MGKFSFTKQYGYFGSGKYVFSILCIYKLLLETIICQNLFLFLEPAVLEQVLIAAVDCSKMGIARQCAKELHKEFPNSYRVRILESMIYEAVENYTKALQILNGIVKLDVTNSAARKRKISIYKSIGKNTEAIKELTEYLKTYVLKFHYNIVTGLIVDD